MRIPGLKTAQTWWRWAGARIFGGAVILGYHRIARAQVDSFYNCVSPDNFSQQMEVIRQHANPVSLDVLTTHLGDGKIPPKTVCVTLDDGYQDALTHARPILEKYEIPATVFVVAGNLGGEFWWDELERLVTSAPEDAGPLHLSDGRSKFEMEFSVRNSAARFRQINATANFLRPIKEVSRRMCLQQVRLWARQPDTGLLPAVRSMTPAELVSLSESKLIQIGSHSVSHPVFAELTQQERLDEIGRSKHQLEEILGEQVQGFSYPNGSFTQEDPALVSQSGYSYACRSGNGLARPGWSRFALPRFWPADMAGEQFRRWLQIWI